jgi:hypothetical protein
MDFKLSVRFDDKLTRNGKKRFSLVFQGQTNEEIVISGFLLPDGHQIICPSFHLKDGTPYAPVRLSPELHRGLLHEISKEEGSRLPGSIVHV